MPGPEEKEKEKAAEAEKGEVTFESMLAELPITDEQKQALTNLVTNLVTSITQTNERLAAIEAKASEFNAKKYEGAGLSAEQIFSIEMAKATAPAAAAQQQLISAVLTGRGGGDSGLGGLVKSAESLNTLRNFLLPQPSPLQVAQEKAQIHQMIAQTRLMNKVTGKQTDSYLDHLEKELGEEGEGE